eukprot:SAG31_NODE_12869_length_910_cov_1.364982_2_plen_257_part_00
MYGRSVDTCCQAACRSHCFFKKNVKEIRHTNIPYKFSRPTIIGIIIMRARRRRRGTRGRVPVPYIYGSDRARGGGGAARVMLESWTGDPTTLRSAHTPQAGGRDAAPRSSCSSDTTGAVRTPSQGSAATWRRDLLDMTWPLLPLATTAAGALLAAVYGLQTAAASSNDADLEHECVFGPSRKDVNARMRAGAGEFSLAYEVWEVYSEYAFAFGVKETGGYYGEHRSVHLKSDDRAPVSATVTVNLGTSARPLEHYW